MKWYVLLGQTILCPLERYLSVFNPKTNFIFWQRFSYVLNAAHLYFETSLVSVTLREKCPNTEFFLVRIWTLFTQCEIKGFPQKDSGNYKEVRGRKNNYLIFVMVFFPSSNWYRLMVVVHLIKKFPWTYYRMLVLKSARKIIYKPSLQRKN